VGKIVVIYVKFFQCSVPKIIKIGQYFTELFKNENGLLFWYTAKKPARYIVVVSSLSSTTTRTPS